MQRREVKDRELTYIGIIVDYEAIRSNCKTFLATHLIATIDRKKIIYC